MSAALIRHGRAADLPTLTDIYNHFVVNTHITFDVAPYEVAQRRPWFEKFAEGGRYPLLVMEEAGAITGYAHSLPLKDRAAYDTSVETTIYLSPGAEGSGRGTRLYTALLDLLAKQDIHRAYGMIALPNEGSIALHKKLGFRSAGLLHEVGRKFGRYYDVEWVERGF